jgi:hypothetical protein
MSLSSIGGFAVKHLAAPFAGGALTGAGMGPLLAVAAEKIARPLFEGAKPQLNNYCLNHCIPDANDPSVLYKSAALGGAVVLGLLALPVVPIARHFLSSNKAPQNTHTRGLEDGETNPRPSQESADYELRDRSHVRGFTNPSEEQITRIRERSDTNWDTKNSSTAPKTPKPIWDRGVAQHSRDDEIF